MSYKDQFEHEMKLDLQEVEQEIKWWDYKLRAESESYLAPEEKLKLLQKKYAIINGIKTLHKFYK